MSFKRVTMEDLLLYEKHQIPVTALTKSEIILLGHLASGARLDVVAALMGKNRGTVGVLATGAFHKMAALSTAHAVAEGLHFGLIVRASDGAYIPAPEKKKKT